MRGLTALVWIAIAVVVAIFSSGLTGLCGGYSECGWSSKPTIAALLAWVGLIALTATLVSVLAAHGPLAASIGVLTFAVYIAWLVALVLSL